MKNTRSISMNSAPDMNRRDFIKAAGAGTAVTAGGLVLGVPAFDRDRLPPPAVETNIADFMKVPRTRHSLPGPFPGRVVKVTDPKSLRDDTFDAAVISQMLEKGVTALTGQSMTGSFTLLFDEHDVVGIKVNPVGPPLINTRPELAEAVIA